MLGRLGIVARLSAILMLALLALWALGAGFSYVTRVPVVPLPGALPLPHQVAAVIELLETSDDNRRKTVLAAASSDTLSIALSDTPPEVPPEVRRLKAVEWLVGRYVGTLKDREVIATLDASDVRGAENLDAGRFWRLARQPLRLAVGLKGGGYAVFETRGEISRRLFGLPPGFWLGALGSLVGIAAIVAVWREARPLQDLSKAVSRFSGDGQPTRVAARGAPELRRLIEEVNRMQERITTLLKGRTILLGAVSHDLKTYITRLKLRVEMIVDPEQQARAERDLDDMTVLIEDALAVARGTTVRDRMGLVDLGDILRTICAEHPNITLGVHARELFLDGDPVALRRLFTNLIENAIRYGGGRPTVSASENGKHLRVIVDDDGPGIPANERELVFEPFYRRESSRNRETGGSGLGLAIAKQIVELHDGSIDLADAPARGLRVIVNLPPSKVRAVLSQ